MSETSCNDSLKDFCRIIVDVHGPEYINRCPTDAEKQRSVDLMERRGFPGCVASWDCKHLCGRIVHKD